MKCTSYNVSMNKYWFKPKKYGWGFMPISWEGWVSTLILVVIIYAIAIYTEIVVAVILVGILAVVFSIFATKVTRGKVKWRWGSEE